MLNHRLPQIIASVLEKNGVSNTSAEGQKMHNRFLFAAAALWDYYQAIYGVHPNRDACFDALLQTIAKAHNNRAADLQQQDAQKEKLDAPWFTSNKLAGMSLYVDRFCGNLKTLPSKLPYLQELGVNVLHLMPLFQSPDKESDGGYAVSDFRSVDQKFGNLEDLQAVQKAMAAQGMHLMLDIVFNHTSHRHEWAQKAKSGDPQYMDFFYMYDGRTVPNQFEQSMPEVFPDAAPGNFTWVPECSRWVMTVFHNYQWDLNYSNPAVFVAMLDTVLFYANLGVDILRIDAPAFIWKEVGTTCQNLPQAHILLKLLKQCVQVAAPGMALLGEAIVAPRQIMPYFGDGSVTGAECDFAYNATHMALQWDALATGDTRVMLAAQPVLQQKPLSGSWITYTRCHDDIGLGYEDAMIAQAGYTPYEHRKFMQQWYSGNWPLSDARGALFSFNPKTGDARISGTLASLCGLEKAVEAKDNAAIEGAVQKILLMQAHSFFIGGLPMIFYGDEVGYTNDYSYQLDAAKSYDNRWMHRPIINWKKNSCYKEGGTVEQKIFSGTKKLLSIRTALNVVADGNNIFWASAHNIHAACFVRTSANSNLFCVFNFSKEAAYLTWFVFREHGLNPASLKDHWSGKEFLVGADHEYLVLQPYQFMLLQQLP